MRILFLSQRVPYPPDRGDKIPTYHYVRHLAANHDVSVTCLADGVGDLSNVAGLRGIVRDVEAVAVRPAAARVRALAALAGGRPLTAAYFDEPELRDRVRRRVESCRYDAALVFSSGVAQFVEPFADLPRVIQFADLDSQKWALYAAHSGAPKSWVYGVEARRLLAYERRLATAFSRSLVCSPRECDDFSRLIGGATVECLPNGVDLEYFQPRGTDRVADSLVFTGVMNYRPNVDGVVWFCREVWPSVRRHVPSATLTICGASPTRAVQELGREAGVTVTGAVADVRPYLHRAAIAVVPLRMARGIQNKLLEAMAAGLAAVATTSAWAGIDASPGDELVVADEPDEFADAVVSLLRDRRQREEMGAAARAAAESRYSWSRTLDRLESIMTEVAVKRRPAAVAVPS
jgi:sugar transferase (PEP-CTERM/EpsH1 system associated)